MISRRILLKFMGGSPLLAAGGFWDKKPPTSWSEDEIMQMTTHSPWARETNLDFDVTDFVVPGSGSPYAGNNGSGIGATTERPAGVLKRAPVLVRWESAKPIRDALLVPIPRDFAGRYVLSVSNVPPEAMLGEKRLSPGAPPIPLQSFLENLQAAATLEAQGKEPAGAGIVRLLARSDSTYLFGFSKDLLPLTVRDKEVLFTLRTKRVSVKARFQPKDMVYKGVLAL
ncbi:MAG: hypothetical protein KGN84_05935 [Acidobacteriota bacterium]|nr:hypothetical protein [Acidobacteriota bacterium]